MNLEKLAKSLFRIMNGYDPKVPLDADRNALVDDVLFALSTQYRTTVTVDELKAGSAAQSLYVFSEDGLYVRLAG